MLCTGLCKQEGGGGVTYQHTGGTVIGTTVAWPGSNSGGDVVGIPVMSFPVVYAHMIVLL